MDLKTATIIASRYVSKEDTRYAIDGILIEAITPTELHVVATDGHRLVVCRVSIFKDGKEQPHGISVGKSATFPPTKKGYAAIRTEGTGLVAEEFKTAAKYGPKEGNFSFPSYRDVIPNFSDLEDAPRPSAGQRLSINPAFLAEAERDINETLLGYRKGNYEVWADVKYKKTVAVIAPTDDLLIVISCRRTPKDINVQGYAWATRKPEAGE